MKKKFGGVYDEKVERRSKQEEAEVVRRPAAVTRHGRPSYNVRMATVVVYRLADLRRYHHHMRDGRLALASNEMDIRRCCSVLRQLRSHLEESAMVDQIVRQQAAGYLLAYVESDQVIRSVAGFRYSENLAYGKFMYVDDLVTDSDDRSQGFGKLLFDWLVAAARERGCEVLALDSGVQRFGAHRFYLVNRMSIMSHHFILRL
jgi:GNAT superfamily N-acetyltransferase